MMTEKFVFDLFDSLSKAIWDIEKREVYFLCLKIGTREHSETERKPYDRCFFLFLNDYFQIENKFDVMAGKFKNNQLLKYWI